MEIEADEIRAEVDRLLHSRSLESSEIHRHLLQYLADKSIAGESDRLKEYTIGLEALGKPPSYDPKHDSIVRLHVSRLRQKLATYYQTEGSTDPVRISLPKGGLRLAVEPAPMAAPGAVPGTWWTPRWRLRFLLGALLLTVAWAMVATVSLVRLHRVSTGIAGQWSPELERIWAPFLQSNRPLVLCLGTPLFVRLPDLGFFRDPKANEWQEVQNSDRVALVRKSAAVSEITPLYAFTGAGEASAAILISKLLSSRERSIALTRSNILSWQQLVDDDVIFVGPPKFNTQLQTASVSHDLVVEPEGIRNLHPRTGEPVFLKDRIIAGRQSEGETHALISLVPGVSGAGNLLVVAGNASADTFAAAEWLTEPWRAAELNRRLRSASGELPRYYQVVLKVAFKQGIPVQSSYVFHHVLQRTQAH